MITMNNNGICFCREVEDELSKRRFRNDRILKERIERLKKEHPEVLAVREEMNGVGYEMGLKIMASPKDAEALSLLAHEMTEKKRAEYTAALKGIGLPEDYLEKQFTCRECLDTGIKDGRMCSCVKQVLIEASFKGSGISREQNFESFRHGIFAEAKDNRALDRMYDVCFDYAKRFPKNELPDMLLLGVPGVGKTFLLNCIGGEVLRRGRSVLKITANRLVNSILESIRNDEASRPDFIMPELLIIDDLGSEPMINNITVESLLSIICERQDQGRATILSTNKSFDQLQEDYGQRIASRLFSPQRVRMIEIKTPSIRMMKI